MTLRKALLSASTHDGQLVYTTEEGLVWSSRKTGWSTMYDDSIALAVSIHTRPARYGLSFLQAPVSMGVHGLVDETREVQTLIHLKRWMIHMRRQLDGPTIQRVIINLLLLVLQVLSPTWSQLPQAFSGEHKNPICNAPVHLQWSLSCV